MDRYGMGSIVSETEKVRRTQNRTGTAKASLES